MDRLGSGLGQKFANCARAISKLRSRRILQIAQIDKSRATRLYYKAWKGLRPTAGLEMRHFGIRLWIQRQG